MEDDKLVRPSNAPEAGPSNAPEAGPSKAPEGRPGRSAMKKEEGGTSKVMTYRGKEEGGTSKAMTDRGKEAKWKRKRGDFEAEGVVQEYLLTGELKNFGKMYRCERNQMQPMKVVEAYNNGVATYMVQQIFT